MARKPRAKIWRGWGTYDPKGVLWDWSATEEGAINQTGWGRVRTDPEITRSSMRTPEDIDAAKAQGWTVRPIKITPQ